MTSQILPQSLKCLVPRKQHTCVPGCISADGMAPPPPTPLPRGKSLFLAPSFPSSLPLPGLLNPSPHKLWEWASFRTLCLPSLVSWLTNFTPGMCPSLRSGFSDSTSTFSARIICCLFRTVSLVTTHGPPSAGSLSAPHRGSFSSRTLF